MKALESLISCDIVRQNLNVLYDAEKNFIKAKSSERIMWASRHNVRTYCEENYQNGDKVFYKKRAVKGWEITTTVLGNEANFVLIRHVSAFYRCHPCHLMKTTQQKSPTTPDVNPVNGINKRTFHSLRLLVNIEIVGKKEPSRVNQANERKQSC